MLPRGYQRLEKSTLIELLRLFAPLPRKLSGDAFGLIYEDFLSNFAMAEGSPRRRVLHAALDRPAHRRDHRAVPRPGLRPRLRIGRHVRPVRQVRRAPPRAPPPASCRSTARSRRRCTVPLAKMNLALHGLSGDIRLGNSYYEDLHHAVGAFDFVMANPPFNVNSVDKDKLAGDHALPVRPPQARQRQLPVDPAVLLRSERQRTGRVRHGQLGRRRRPLRARDPPAAHRVRGRRRDGRDRHQLLLHRHAAGHAVVPRQGKAAPSAKTRCCSSTPGTSTARSTAPTATSCPSRSSCSPTSCGSTAARTSRRSTAATLLLKERFPDGTYVDVPGLCKVATRAEIEAQGWSLNPGRYTGTARSTTMTGTSPRSSPTVRRVHPPQRRSRRAPGQGRRCCPGDPRRMTEWS